MCVLGRAMNFFGPSLGGRSPPSLPRGSAAVQPKTVRLCVSVSSSLWCTVFDREIQYQSLSDDDIEDGPRRKDAVVVGVDQRGFDGVRRQMSLPSRDGRQHPGGRPAGHSTPRGRSSRTGANSDRIRRVRYMLCRSVRVPS